MAAGRLVPVGVVLRAHGTAGELMVYPHLKDLSYYAGLGEVVLRDHGDRGPRDPASRGG